MPRLQLVTLKGVKVDEEVYEVLLPTPDGQIGVFAHHSPLVTQAVNGVIKIRKKQGDPDDLMVVYACYGGVIEVANNIVKVLADEADLAEDLAEAKEQAAYQAALKLRSEAKDQISLDKAQQLIDRTAVRLQVAGLKRHRRIK